MNKEKITKEEVAEYIEIAKHNIKGLKGLIQRVEKEIHQDINEDRIVTETACWIINMLSIKASQCIAEVNQSFRDLAEKTH